MDPDQRDLLNFHHVALHGSFTKAADSLQVSKSHISKSISRLEQQLQKKILQRSTRQLVLTEAGEQLFATTTMMQATLTQGLEKLQVLAGKPKGKLKISAPPAFAVEVLAPLLVKFMQAYPDVTIELDLASKLVDIISGGYDLVFRSALLKDSNLIARKLFDCDDILVASPTLFNQHQMPVLPQDLERLPCIAYQASGSSKINWQLKKNNQNRVVNLTPVLTCNLMAMLKKCALNGAGVARLPLFMVKDELQQKQLYRVLPEWNLSGAALYMVYPSREYLPLKTRCFIDFVSAKLTNRGGLSHE